MADLALDFLNQVKGFGQSLASPFEYLAKADIVDPVRQLSAQVTGNKAAQAQAQQSTMQNLGLGQNDSFTGGLKTFASNAAQVGLDAYGGELARPAEKLASPILKPVASAVGDVTGSRFAQKVAGGALQTAVGGATLGAGQAVAQGVGSKQKLNAKNLSLDFLQGAQAGGTQGAVFGSLAGASGINRNFDRGIGENGIFGALGGVARKISRSGLISDDTASKVADSESEKEIEKTLEPETGPIVAHDVAPTLANQTKDPNLVKNVVKNDVDKKVGKYQSQPTENPIGPPGSAEEASLFNQGPQGNFLNAPGEEGPNHVSKVRAMQNIQDMLNEGDTPGEALQHWMDTVGGGMESEKEGQDYINQLIQGGAVDFNKGNVGSRANPRFEEGKKLVNDQVARGDTDSVINKSRTVNNLVVREGAKAVNEVQQLSRADRDLFKQARDKTPQQIAHLAEGAKDPPQFMKAYQAIKNYDNLIQGVGSGGLGQNVPYRQNHLLTHYVKSPLEDTGPNGEGSAQTIHPSYAFGRKGTNLEDAFPDFLDELKHDVDVKSNSLAQRSFSKSINEAMPSMVAEGNLPGGYRQVNLPFAKGISLPTEMAAELNKRALPDKATGGWKGYDTLNSEMKNLKLGGGLFHSLNVLGSWAGQQILSGKFFTHPEDTATMLKATFSPESMKEHMTQLDNNGVLRAADRLGLEYNRFSVSQDVGGRLTDKIPGLHQLHESIFGRQIPMMKLLTLQQQLEKAGIDPTKMSDDDIKTGTKLAKEINNNYGGINRMIQGMRPSTFQKVSRVLLSTDYTEASLKTLVDSFTKGGADGNLARQVVVGKALLFAGLATGLGAAGGEFKGKDPKQIAQDIIYKAINPEFQFGSYTAALPETQLSEFAKPIAESIGNEQKGENAANPLKDFFTARAAAIPSEAEQLAQNRNFEGQPIRGTDYYGRPVSPLATAENIAGSVLPIPASQGLQTASGNENIGAALANTAGLNAKPTYSLQYAPVEGQTYVEELQRLGAPKQQLQLDTQFYNIIGSLDKQRKQALSQAITYNNQNKDSKAQQAIDSFNQKLAQALQPWAQAGGEKYFDSILMQQLNSSKLTTGYVNREGAYDTKTNPTAYGDTLAQSSLAQQAQQYLQSQPVSSNT